jgi:DNA-binding GntR family transcriptional regulator
VPRKRTTGGALGDTVAKTYDMLLELIVSGRLSPGSPLIERQMAELTRSSRPTVRSALQRLEQERFITTAQIGERYSRFLVAPVTIEAMREGYYIFGALDGLAARKAAEFPIRERDALAAEMQKRNDELLRYGRGDEPRFNEIEPADARFHGSYVEAAAGPWLRQQYDTLRPHMKRFGRFYGTALTQKVPTEVFQEHDAIVSAIRSGEPD